MRSWRDRGYERDWRLDRTDYLSWLSYIIQQI